MTLKKGILFCISLLFFCEISSYNAYANEILQDRIINDLENSGASQSMKVVEKTENKGKIVKEEEFYIKIEYELDENQNIKNKPKVKKYSKLEYELESKNQKTKLQNTSLLSTSNNVQYTLSSTVQATNAYSTGYNYEWLKMYYTVYDHSSESPGAYVAQLYFEWLKVPFFKGQDIIALAHDSNALHIDKAGTFVYYPNASLPYYREYTASGNASSAYSNVNGMFGFKFDLIDPSIDHRAYGSYIQNGIEKLTLNGRPKGILTMIGESSNINNTGSMFSFFYGHQEKIFIGEPSLSFSAPGGITLSGTTSVGDAYADVRNDFLYKFNENLVYGEWIQINGIWYFKEMDGNHSIGWRFIDSKWYYFRNDGSMVANDWIQSAVSGSWYYLGQNGAMMINSWIQSSKTGIWYYVGNDGVMYTSRWYQSPQSGKWYYFDANGAMLANTSLVYNNKTYYFDISGACTNP